MALIAGATIGAGLLGAGSSMVGSGKASSAAKDAAAQQKQMYLQTRADLSPFVGAGSGVLPGLNALAMSGPTGGGPDYISQAAGERPLQMTQANLEATPGYQFDLSQGLKATQSAAAARGLGVSGASLKGAATYATGLANKTYQDQFNMQQQRFTDLLNLNTGQQGQLQNQYTRLHDTAALGENAAAQTGTAGTSAAATAGNDLNQAGLASAAGTTGATNALTGAANSYLGYQNFQDLLSRYAPTAGGATGGYTPASFANSNTGYTTGGFSGGNIPITG
jgi:hypothetical protein